MTTKCPEAQWDPLGTQAQPRMSRHDIVCVHTMVGSLEGVRGMFKSGGFTGVESHFGVGGGGKAYQWQDLDFTADANFQGNHRVISIETEDKNSEFFPAWEGSDVPAWTDEQMDKIADLIAWCCKKYDIPAKLVEDSQSHRRGLAYHRQGIDGAYTDGFKGRQGVGELWSSSGGKLCPATRRIKQFINIVIPAVQDILNPPKKDNDYRVTCVKKGEKDQVRFFEHATDKKTGMDEFILRKVRKGWSVRVRRVADQDD